MVCVLGDIWGSIGVYGVGNNIVRNKGEGYVVANGERTIEDSRR